MGGRVSRKQLVGDTVKTFLKCETSLAEKLKIDSDAINENEHLPVNFNFLNQHLFTSGQFISREQLLSIHKYFGIKNVINLNTTSYIAGDPLSLMENRVLNIDELEYIDLDKDILSVEGINFYHLPISDGKVPTSHILSEFNVLMGKIMSSGENTLFHCWKGTGRAKLMAFVGLKNYYANDFESVFQEKAGKVVYQKDWLMHDENPNRDDELLLHAYEKVMSVKLDQLWAKEDYDDEKNTKEPVSVDRERFNRYQKELLETMMGKPVDMVKLETSLKESKGKH